MDHLFKVNKDYNYYKNAISMLVNYRKYKVDKQLNEDEFMKKLLSDQFVLIKCVASEDIKIDVFYIYSKATITTKAQDFRHLLSNPEKNIIIIVPNPFKNNILTVIREEYKGYKIQQIPHYIFTNDATKGPNCYPHRIISDKERFEILEREKIAPEKMPFITFNDPQCIYIDAKIGDILEIATFSEVAGKRITYRIVQPEFKIQDDEDEEDENDE